MPGRIEEKTRSFLRNAGCDVGRSAQTGDDPGDFRLDDQSGALYVSLDNGPRHRGFAPDEMTFPPYYYAFDGSMTRAVPEPETCALMAMGLAGVALGRRLKRSA